MKKFFAVLVLVMLLCVPSYAANPDKDIIILTTNDVHCGIDDSIGYSGLAYYKHEAEKLTPYVILADAGDAVQGGTIGTISQGRYIIEIMNALGYDVAVPGNHEFDYGWAQFENFIKNLNCSYIASNLRELSTGNLLLKPYKLFTFGGSKVAFVGAATPESLTKSTPSTFMDDNGKYIYDFDGDMTGEKLSASIQKAVDSARDEGADFVILLGHLGTFEDVVEAWSSPIIAAKTHGIDAIIDGHSHEVIADLKIKNSEGKEVPIIQTGTKLKYIGQIKIDTEGKISAGLVGDVEGRDEKITALIQDIRERYEDTLKQKLGHTDFKLWAVDENKEWLLRNNETNLCNLVTDALLASGSADIALMNAGGIRADINPGDITFNDALSVLPFNNTVCIAEVSGQVILDELEMGVRLMPNRSGGLLQVAGMSYTVDVSIPSSVKLDEHNRLIEISGARRVKDVMINGKPIDPEKKYSVVSLNFVIREGGDGHKFEGMEIIRPDYDVTSDVFARFIKSLGELPEKYKEAEGRLKVINN